MRIHSEKITAQDIFAATKANGMTGVDAAVMSHRSHTHTWAFEVTLTGNSGRRVNTGTSGGHAEDHAATWDEWGIFLAHLFAVDPQARVGGAKYPVYADAEEFHDVTYGRFETLAHSDQHKNHRWNYVAPREFECTKCEARKSHALRWTARWS